MGNYSDEQIHAVYLSNFEFYITITEGFKA